MNPARILCVWYSEINYISINLQFESTFLFKAEIVETNIVPVPQNNGSFISISS